MVLPKPQGAAHEVRLTGDRVDIAGRAFRALYSCEEQPFADVRKVIAPFLCTTTIFVLAATARKEMVGTRRLELLTSTVSR